MTSDDKLDQVVFSFSTAHLSLLRHRRCPNVVSTTTIARVPRSTRCSALHSNQLQPRAAPASVCHCTLMRRKHRAEELIRITCLASRAIRRRAQRRQRSPIIAGSHASRRATMLHATVGSEAATSPAPAPALISWARYCSIARRVRAAMCARGLAEALRGSCG